jgi:hypothetical protein
MAYNFFILRHRYFSVLARKKRKEEKGIPLKYQDLFQIFNLAVSIPKISIFSLSLLNNYHFVF